MTDQKATKPTLQERLDELLNMKYCLTLVQFTFLVFGCATAGIIAAWTNFWSAALVMSLFLLFAFLWILSKFREHGL